MPTVVGIRLRYASKIYGFSPGHLTDLERGEHVIVDTARGRAMGRVVIAPREVPKAEIRTKLKPVIRRATAWDAVQQDQYCRREPEALERTREVVAEHELPMKVVSVEHNFDGSRLTVYFSAESRVDFRALVKELSKAFETSVEMRQIGVRDEAKLLDGYGRCGYRLCCASWLQEFEPISIRLAKQQNLPLNPAEISGSCGRLLCCLSYESEVYAEALKRLPAKRSKVFTHLGEGTVVRVHPLKETVTVKLQSGDSRIEVPVAELITPEAGKEEEKKGEEKKRPRRRSDRSRRRTSSRR